MRATWTAAVVLLAAVGCGTGVPGLDPNVYVVEHTDYNPPPPADDGLADDRLDEKKTTFVPELVDRRPEGGWLVNQSEAVIKLDVPLVRGDHQQHLLVLHPSYKAAIAAAGAQATTLPSVNLLDGKAKQFDDGLYAAIDQAYFQGIQDKLPGHLALVRRFLDKVGENSDAAPYLAAGLTLGGQETTVPDKLARDNWIRNFHANPAVSKPIGFYTWNDTLKKCWAFMRFFQQPLKEDEPTTTALVAALAADSALKADYESAAQFFGKLTNPLLRLTLADLVGADVKSKVVLNSLRSTKGVLGPGVAFFPPSTSRETELFNKLFPLGLPDGADLMKELVQAIRSGKINLAPRPNSGWYDRQVYALETLLLAEKGEEHHKLLLTKPYKKRMLEAFQALITKRRETHVRSLEMAAPASAVMPAELENLKPRLRVEPCPSFYVRTARSYAFLHNFLLATLGEETLRSLHGLRQEVPRMDDLATELEAQKILFYGLYLVSCDDIGLAPTLHEGEVANPDACYDGAVAWLAKLDDEPDLAADTRVAVPIYVDPQKGTTRLWVTLGVRLTHLNTEYARPPRIKSAQGEGEWQAVEPWKLQPASFLIAVDEFAEVEIPTLAPPNREELRKLCDVHKTKEKIVAALGQGKW